MSGHARASGAAGACAACLRRSWLLGALGGPLEYRSRDRERLSDVLTLDDGELMEALAGRRTSELRAAYERFDAAEIPREARAHSICHHRRDYPRALRTPSAPRMLYLSAPAERLTELVSAPVVAIVGSPSASDYGMAVAASIARGLAASGVTVVASLGDGIAAAAHTGALEAGAGAVAVMAGGLSVGCPVRRRGPLARIVRRGCAVAELPPDRDGRRWGELASERTVVGLADATIVVEADDSPAGLEPARMARALGRTLGAVPGRVSAPLSRGPHALLIGGASLVRGPRDALELLGPPAGQPRRPPGERSMWERAIPSIGCAADLPARLRATLERVGAGYDTPDRLTHAGEDPHKMLLSLSELELLGLLERGDGGRYVSRDPLEG